MGMGAPKQGSTLPPQGGKGGGRQPVQPQVPMAGGKAPGAVQPGQPPYMPIGYPPVQPQVPAQGGKAPVPMGGMLGGGGNPMQPQQPQQPLNDPLNRGGMPFQGFNPAGTDAGPRPFVSPNPLQPQQPGQVPAQGGKAPLTLPPGIEGKPIPQVSPPQGIRFPSDFTPPAPGQTYINPNINPAGFTGTLPPRLQQPAPVMTRASVPQVMTRPVPQVMPRPVPQVMPRGLAGLRGRR